MISITSHTLSPVNSPIVGVDIIENSRIKKIHQKFGKRFLKRILTEEEIKILNSKTNQLEFLCGRFCAKEAFFKATNKHITSFQDLYIVNNKDGMPEIILKNQKIQYKNISLSISHSRDYTIAVCIVEY